MRFFLIAFLLCNLGFHVPDVKRIWLGFKRLIHSYFSLADIILFLEIIGSYLVMRGICIVHNSIYLFVWYRIALGAVLFAALGTGLISAT